MQRQMWKGSVCSKIFIIIIPVKTGNAPAKINWTNVLDIASLDEFSFYLCGNKAFTHLYLKFSYRSPCQWKITSKFHDGADDDAFAWTISELHEKGKFFLNLDEYLQSINGLLYLPIVWIKIIQNLFSYLKVHLNNKLVLNYP